MLIDGKDTVTISPATWEQPVKLSSTLSQLRKLLGLAEVWLTATVGSQIAGSASGATSSV